MKMNLTERIVEGTILTIICLLAFFGNVSLWFVVIKTPSLRETSYYMVLLLSVADIAVSVLSMPVTVYTLIRGDWAFSENTCVAFGFISMSTFIASVMSLCTISVNRYVKVCRSTLYHRIYSVRNVVFMTAGVWCFSFFLAIPPLVGWGRYTFIANQSFCFCEWKMSKSYAITQIAICFLGPFSVMSFSYYKILKMFRSSSNRLFGGNRPIFTKPKLFSRKISPNLSSHSTEYGETSLSKVTVHELPKQARDVDQGKESEKQVTVVSQADESLRHPEKQLKSISSNNNINGQVGRQVRRRREEFMLSAALLLVIFVFVVCWFPFCVVMCITIFSTTQIPRTAGIFALMLGYMNSCCNPLIYGFLNKKFKEGYRVFFRSMCSCPCKKSRTTFVEGGGIIASTN